MKHICQSFSIVITTGNRSGRDKIIFELYEKLILIYGGFERVEPTNYGIESSCVNEYSANEDNFADKGNTSTSNSSSSSSNYIAGGGPSGSWINSTSRSIKETTDRVSLCNNNNLSDPETDPVLMK